MSYQRIALRLALVFSLSVGVSGLAQVEASAAPACPATGACYFQWTDRNQTTHKEDRPDTAFCYQMPDGAIAGLNKTTKKVFLYKDRDCLGGSRATVSAGLGWRDPDNVYFSFDFVG
jgi:hypothetical protein